MDMVTRLEGTAFYAQLWAGPDINSLTAWCEPLTFRTGAPGLLPPENHPLTCPVDSTRNPETRL